MRFPCLVTSVLFAAGCGTTHASEPGSPSPAEDASPHADAAIDAPADSHQEAQADAQQESTDAGPSALHLLFIGNSYTYVNDLPSMLASIAATAGKPPLITTAEVTQGGATLGVHWSNGEAQTQINSHQFTHVVLQGQSWEPIAGYTEFMSFGEQFENLIVDAGAKPTLFVTWARAPGDPTYAKASTIDYMFSPGQMQDELTSAYDDLAKQTPGTLLSCAGEAFRRSHELFPSIVLHQDDFSHPTVAGTYLAACTFYVALTGQSVPAQSDVPAGLTAQDAEHLRDIALIGSDCADVKPKGAVVWGDSAQTMQFPNADGTFPFASPFEYGTAGMPVPHYFVLTNVGPGAAGLADGGTLSAPFVWAAGAAFPGGTGAVSLEGASYEFCSATLDPGKSCAIGVSYTGASTATSVVTVSFAGSYWPAIARELHGTSTTRAALTISEDPGWVGCSDATCFPASFWAGSTLNLVVSNRGAMPTTGISVGTPLDAPFLWGPVGGPGTFPGGTGTGTVGGQSYAYCEKQALALGEQCMITLSFADPGDGGSSFATSANLAYSDASGPVSPNANRQIKGDVAHPWPPP